MPEVPAPTAFEGLRALQHYCFDNAEEKGFHARGHRLRLGVQLTAENPDQFPTEYIEDTKAALADYYANRLMLIVGEGIEAHEEIRDGHAMDYQYESETKPGKPEGVPSELADILIRVLDLAQEANIDLASVVQSKMLYNAGRPAMHGRKF